MRTSHSILLLLLLITGGAASGEVSSTCESIGSSPAYGTVAGGVDNLAAVLDQDLASFAKLQSSVPGTFVGGGGNYFLPGSRAGFFITPPDGASLEDITVATYLLVDGTVLEVATGTALDSVETTEDPATHYVSITTRLAFNGVKLIINTLGNAEYLVFEACGNAAIE